MVYAKQVKNDKVVALLTYDYEPCFDPESDTVIITEDEYNDLAESFKPVDTEEISDSEALNIILGEGGTTNEA